MKRKATTKASTGLTQEEFTAVKKQYLHQIKKAVKDGKIPRELVINWDQSGVNVVPSSQWTQAEKGATRVEIAAARDKRQITVTVAGTLSGKLLLFQILYKGKTERRNAPTNSIPRRFWHLARTLPIIGPMHGETCIRFLKNIILPYIDLYHSKKSRLGRRAHGCGVI